MWENWRSWPRVDGGRGGGAHAVPRVAKQPVTWSDISDALRDLSVTNWRLYDRSNAYECMLTLFSTSPLFLSVCMS